MSETSGSPEQARIRPKRRIPAIWIIPALALGIGAWLAWRDMAAQGPTITVRFENAEGLTPGQSLLKYKDLTLGTVKGMA